MKTLKYLSIFFISLFAIYSCESDQDEEYSLDYLAAPSNVAVSFTYSDDNSGLVTLSPTAEGAQSFIVNFGDASDTTQYDSGESIEHTYLEGTYTVEVEAVGITGLTTDITDTLVVTFSAPENLVVSYENDASTSLQVNFTATADDAIEFYYYFGDGDTDATTVDETGEVSYTYSAAGDYEVTVVASSGAIATTDTTFTVTATAISAPTEAAPTPSAYSSSVISIYSDAYDDVADTDFNPNWGQTNAVSYPSVDGDNMLMYAGLDYQGTQFGSTVDASSMEYLHVDMWTADATSVLIYPISSATGEDSYDLDITLGEWVSYDIPLSYFTDLGLSMEDLIQFKFVGDGSETIYLDNLYFYKTATETLSIPMDFESSILDYSWGEFGGSVMSVASNPSSSGINTSATVAEVVKYSGGETWGGNYISLDDVIDFSTNTSFQIKVYSPRAGVPVIFKVENDDDASVSFEETVNTTVANEWETLTFDFSTIDTSNEYQKLVIFMDYGTVGDGTSDYTYYFDDIELVD
ncbi:PKD domain-containing protein [Labilibaculum sp.]|uniref:PKD domain-containing protein n=1 Tax=Labilibaculum sp. TaxID=2060723 RepID=UPI00356A54FD